MEEESATVAAGAQTPVPAVKQLASAFATPSSSDKIPTGTLAARKQECISSLKQQELERKFQEELRWYKKQADHFQGEYESARVRRKELEEQLEAVKGELEKKVREAQLEAEDLKLRGGEKGIKAELELAKRELDAIKESKANVQAQLADAVEGNKALHRQLHEAREKLAAAEAERSAAQEAAAAAQGVQKGIAEQLSEAKQQLQAAAEKLEAVEAQHQAAQAAVQEAHQGVAQQLEHKQAELVKAEEEAASQAQQVKQLRGELLERSAAAEQLQGQVSRLEAQARELHQQIGDMRQQNIALKEEAAAAQARASIGPDEVAALRAAATTAEAAAAAHKAALERSTKELTELQGEYARAVYDCAKAKAEHSEMAGKLAKAITQKDQLQQRLAALQIAHTEVELCAKLALENDLLQGAASFTADQNRNHTAGSNGTSSVGGQTPGVTTPPNGGSLGGSVGGAPDDGALMRAMAVARQQLEKVRKLAADAQQAADKRVLEVKRSGSLASSTSSTVAAGGA